MKRLFLVLALISTQVFAGGGKSEKAVNYLPGDYTIDTAHTRAAFTISHLVVGGVQGRFNDVTGNVSFGKELKDSKFDVLIKAASIDTGIKQRDDHLKSADFFEVEKYPELTFKSTAVSGSPEDLEIKGLLTIKGVSKEVVLKGAYTGSVVDPWKNQRSVVKLHTKINRKDFNINYDAKIPLGLVVGEEVKIDIISEMIFKK